MPDGKSYDGGTLARRPSGADLLSRLMPSNTVLHFVHISDTHISHDPNYILPEAKHTPADSARALVEQINALPFEPDFVLHTGDVVYDPDPEAYVTAKQIFSRLRYPIYYMAGNHDNSKALQEIMLGSTEVLAPFDYQFEVKGIQFVVVDSNGMGKGPAGFVSVDQLARLHGICTAPDPRPLVVAVHHNVLPTGVPWWDGFMRLTNGEDFHKMLLPAQRRLRGVFHGHVHQGADTYRDGVLYSCVASSWYQIHAWPGQTDTLADYQATPGFNVVTVTPAQTFVRRYQFQP
jgi:3',5'-cyclic-AMP phosphodiesterase